MLHNIPRVNLWWVVSKIMHTYSPITQKCLNVQLQNLCHWNQHVQKATCVEYQAILIISPWSKWSLFFSIAILFQIMEISWNFESAKNWEPFLYIGNPGAMQDVPNISYISIAFPIWWPYLFQKTHKVVFDQEELLKITWKFVHLAFWMCLSQWWWLEVCLTSSLLDKVCISLYNGNFAKKHLILGSPHTPSYPFLLSSPDEIWSLSKKNKKHPWPSHKKNVQLVKKYGTFCS